MKVNPILANLLIMSVSTVIEYDTKDWDFGLCPYKLFPHLVFPLNILQVICLILRPHTLHYTIHISIFHNLREVDGPDITGLE